LMKVKCRKDTLQDHCDLRQSCAGALVFSWDALSPPMLWKAQRHCIVCNAQWYNVFTVDRDVCRQNGHPGYQHRYFIVSQ